MVNFKDRKKIQYSLLGVTLLSLIMLLGATISKGIEESRLSAIGRELQEYSAIKELIKGSKIELSNAQIHLYSYLTTNREEFLDLFYQSLKELSQKIDSTKLFEKNLYIDGATDTLNRERAFELERLERLIDSISFLSPQIKLTRHIAGERIEIGEISSRIEIDERHISDSIPKRNFFQRLSDAFKGEVIVKRDTIYVTARYHTEIDLDRAQSELDSTIDALYREHLNRLQQYEGHLSSLRSKNINLFKVYNNLFTLGTNLIEIYNTSFSKLESQLGKHYNRRNIKIEKTKRSASALLIFFLIAGITLIAYYTKLSFLYESRLEEANKRVKGSLEFKNRLLGMLSHEIRSPLKIMNLFIDRISKKSDDSEIIENLKTIQFTNSSLLLQANQILEYTKDNSRLIELNLEPFSLNEEIEGLITMFRPYIESVNNRLIVENKIEPQIKVLSDRGKFHQLFINLLGNANKFTSQGVVELITESKRVDQEHIRVYTTISDTGIGISKSDLDNIFNPYYRGELSGKVDNLGVGLGLNLCKTIVELFDGTILVTSEQGVGSRVTFDIKMKLIYGEHQEE
ncbi:MAG: HAMP domain-containing sensor histidine kinase [Bacteroidales bacterium]